MILGGEYKYVYLNPLLLRCFAPQSFKEDHFCEELRVGVHYESDYGSQPPVRQKPRLGTYAAALFASCWPTYLQYKVKGS